MGSVARGRLYIATRKMSFLWVARPMRSAICLVSVAYLDHGLARFFEGFSHCGGPPQSCIVEPQRCRVDGIGRGISAGERVHVLRDALVEHLHHRDLGAARTIG